VKLHSLHLLNNHLHLLHLLPPLLQGLLHLLHLQLLLFDLVFVAA